MMPGEATQAQKEAFWRCPKCGRTFRDHVFCPTTPASGPTCNACCVGLEWVEVENSTFIRDEIESRSSADL